MRKSFFSEAAGVRDQRDCCEVQGQTRNEDFVRRDQQAENRRNGRQYGDGTPEVAEAGDPDGAETSGKESDHRELPE